jgi:protein SCO1
MNRFPTTRRQLLSFLVLPVAGAALAQSSRAGTNLYRVPARWRDDQGQDFDLATLQGSWTVLTMAYGACRRICATSLRVMQSVQALADQQRLALNFVVVGLDPSQDKPADWAAFRTTHGLARTNWSFLTGDEAATRVLAARLGIRYWRYGEHTMHDFKLVLVTPAGEQGRAMVAFDEPPSMLLPGR